MHIWGNKTVLRRFQSEKGRFNRAKFFSNGLLILAGVDKNVNIYTVERANGQAVVTFKSHLADVTDIDFVGVGRNIISSSADGTMRLWDCGNR
eukprot:UN16149